MVLFIALRSSYPLYKIQHWYALLLLALHASWHSLRVMICLDILLSHLIIQVHWLFGCGLPPNRNFLILLGRTCFMITIGTFITSWSSSRFLDLVLCLILKLWAWTRRWHQSISTKFFWENAPPNHQQKISQALILEFNSTQWPQRKGNKYLAFCNRYGINNFMLFVFIFDQQ